MKLSKKIALLYFGGTSLSVLVASRGAGGAFVVHARADREYNGIINGAFVDGDGVGAIIRDTVREALGGFRGRVKKLYIGTPHIFCDCIVKPASITLDRARKITDRDTEELIRSVEHIDDQKTVINRSAVYYRVDDGNAVTDAVGAVARKIEARVSLIVADNGFINKLRGYLAGSPFSRVEFISTALAQSIYFINEEIRDKTAVLISCGMFATAVAVVCGDGLMYLRSFNQGIAHVINDASVVLDTTFGVANRLVNTAVISVNMTETDTYEITHEGELKRFSAHLVNDIIKSRMEIMAEHIAKLCHIADGNLLSGNPVFMCGGNIDAVAGARDFFGRALGCHITECVDPMTRQNRAGELTINALLSMATGQEM